HTNPTRVLKLRFCPPPRRGSDRPAQGNALGTEKEQHPCPERAQHNSAPKEQSHTSPGQHPETRGFRPEGAVTYQPRATPWGPKNSNTRALKGHNTMFNLMKQITVRANDRGTG